jgi:LPXTG-motif cell wall-anchored protein
VGRAILGVLLCVVGIVWIGQGTNLIGGSFMSGETIWAVIGGACLAAGLALLLWRRRI